MPIRFRKTFKLLPGVKINVSKHGISTTVGPRGMHLTFNRYGVRQSVGLPGSGLSETSYIIGGGQQNEAEKPEEAAARDVQRIHHGGGLGCEIPGCGCLLLVLLIAAALTYFGADALQLHPAAFLTHSLSQFWYSLIQQAR